VTGDVAGDTRLEHPRLRRLAGLDLGRHVQNDRSLDVVSAGPRPPESRQELDRRRSADVLERCHRVVVGRCQAKVVEDAAHVERLLVHTDALAASEQHREVVRPGRVGIQRPVRFLAAELPRGLRGGSIRD
jgi:hypothetical protein